jgi:hypothetical protein
MKRRCLDPKNNRFKLYGGRGIKVCERWKKFKNFLLDMGDRPSPKHSIERKDNEGNYEPGNCEWATAKAQASNTRNNVLITLDGRTMTMSQWAEEKGMLLGTLWHRLHAGWGYESSINTPVRRMRI